VAVCFLRVGFIIFSIYKFGAFIRLLLGFYWALCPSSGILGGFDCFFAFCVCSLDGLCYEVMCLHFAVVVPLNMTSSHSSVGSVDILGGSGFKKHLHYMIYV
jgi:hypothetical protein